MKEELKRKIARMIIDTKGNFSTKDFEDLGLSFEMFLQMAQIDSKVLVNHAQNILNEEV